MRGRRGSEGRRRRGCGDGDGDVLRMGWMGDHAVDVVAMGRLSSPCTPSSSSSESSVAHVVVFRAVQRRYPPPRPRRRLRVLEPWPRCRCVRIRIRIRGGGGIRPLPLRGQQAPIPISPSISCVRISDGDGMKTVRMRMRVGLVYGIRWWVHRGACQVCTGVWMKKEKGAARSHSAHGGGDGRG